MTPFTYEESEYMQTAYWCGKCGKPVKPEDKVILSRRFCCPKCHAVLRQNRRHGERRVVENRL